MYLQVCYRDVAKAHDLRVEHFILTQLGFRINYEVPADIRGMGRMCEPTGIEYVFEQTIFLFLRFETPSDKM